VKYLKQCHEPRDLQQLSRMIANMGELDVTADLPSRCVQGYESTQAPAIDVSDIP
jgi:hypothetical protein